MKIYTHCTECQSTAQWCKFCGACKHEPHTEECKQDWRTLILSYKV